LIRFGKRVMKFVTNRRVHLGNRPLDAAAANDAVARPGAVGRDLASALGWSDEDLSIREISRGGTRIELARSSIGGQPAALFGKVVARNGFDPLDSAALYGYHATVDWGLLADDQGLTVFNSHWLSEKTWFNLPCIAWADLSNDNPLLQALTPTGILEGTIERVASRQKQPSGFLQPVDDELVERLDNWRDQALRYARDAGQVDSRLQTLYAQLFVLRTVEDRHLDHRVPLLSSNVVNPERINWSAWTNLIGAARDQIGSDLFDQNVAADIPEHVFAGVIHDLYFPRSLPTHNARYDFSWIEADVLGLAYEKYLATVLQPAPPAAQRELFQSPEREVERRSVRKTSGVYYTPQFIRDFPATSCIDGFFAKAERPGLPKVIDFACGSGSFLVAAVDQILKHLKKTDSDRNWARELVEGGNIVGIDVDPNAVNAARLHLWQRLVREQDALPLPNLSDVVIVADGLARETWGKLDHQYDIVLGNPPFLATSLIGSREELEARFRTATGRFDFSYLFVEQALRVLESGGYLGLVVPNRLFRNRNGQTIRELLATQTSIVTIADFGSTRPFDASAYVGCIVAKTRPSQEPPPKTVRVLEVASLTPNFLAALLLTAANDSNEFKSDVLHAFSAHPSSGSPWTLLSEADQRSLVAFEDVSVRLDSIAEVWQGIRTGANDLFIFDLESGDGSQLCKAINGLGESTILEVDLLEHVVFGSEVQRYQVVRAARRLLYPYRSGIVLPDGDLEIRFPNVWAYFMRNRELLAARSSMKQSGGKWYELVRPRDENWLRRPKLLIRDLAPRTAFALDQQGNTFIVGGSAVVPQDTDLLLPLLAYLNSSVIDGLVRRTTPQFRGDFQKFEPQHIQSIPVLDRLVEDTRFTLRLASLASDVVMFRAREIENEAVSREKQIDDLIKTVAGDRGIALAI
jgi:methylase of polypeptide subunit release factors